MAELTVKMEVLDPEGTVVATGDGKTSLCIENPQLWWPAGFGEQPLYTVQVFLLRDGEVMDSWIRRIGLRTMTMSTEKDVYGEKFAHKVNGVEIFAMGGDYIPCMVCFLS